MDNVFKLSDYKKKEPVGSSLDEFYVDDRIKTSIERIIYMQQQLKTIADRTKHNDKVKRAYKLKRKI
tara:strand:+ start:4055 stop:4255 length:201 start_codon:yes stop_codon:yes gene_type:complete